MSLGNLFGQRRVCLWTREHFGTGRGRKRGRAVGFVSIIGWNTKRMQTWNNTTLDRVFRCGILLSSPSYRFSSHIAAPVGILRVSSCPHHICRGPSSKRWNLKLKTMPKKPLHFWGPRQSLLLTMIQLQKNLRCNSGAIKIYRGNFLLQAVYGNIRCTFNHLINIRINSDG